MVTGHRVAAGTDHHSCAPGKVTRAGWEPWDFLERPNSFGYACVVKLTSLTAKPPCPLLCGAGATCFVLDSTKRGFKQEAAGLGRGAGGGSLLPVSRSREPHPSTSPQHFTPELHPSRGSPFPRPRLKPGDSFFPHLQNQLHQAAASVTPRIRWMRPPSPGSLGARGNDKMSLPWSRDTSGKGGWILQV